MIFAIKSITSERNKIFKKVIYKILCFRSIFVSSNKSCLPRIQVRINVFQPYIYLILNFRNIFIKTCDRVRRGNITDCDSCTRIYEACRHIYAQLRGDFRKKRALTRLFFFYAGSVDKTSVFPQILPIFSQPLIISWDIARQELSWTCFRWTLPPLNRSEKAQFSPKSIIFLHKFLHKKSFFTRQIQTAYIV